MEDENAVFAAERSMRHGRTIMNLHWCLLTCAHHPCEDIWSSMRMWPCVMVQQNTSTAAVATPAGDAL